MYTASIKNHPPESVLKLGDRSFSAADPMVMGILNVTPDSFADGGRYTAVDAAVRQAATMVKEGADIIDVGGQSTRPGSQPISVDEELTRVIPVLRELRRQFQTVLISIDTDKAAVAEQALALSVNLVNDVTALQGDNRMAKLLAAAGTPVVLMHAQGSPATMQQNPRYRDVVEEVSTFFQERMDFATRAGIAQKNIILDPGIGFGKSVAHNLLLLRNLDRFLRFQSPLLLGTSLKSFIGKVLELNAPAERGAGTLATLVLGYQKGARIFRVHQVRAAREALQMTRAIMEAA